jgi:hypothetical protein
VENVSDASRLSEDIGLASLGLVELQTALEHRFALQIPGLPGACVTSSLPKGNLPRLQLAAPQAPHPRKLLSASWRSPTTRSIRAGRGAPRSDGCVLPFSSASRSRLRACWLVRTSCARKLSRKPGRSSSWQIMSLPTMSRWSSPRSPRVFGGIQQSRWPAAC